MSASIRGHQGQIKLFQDGSVTNVVDVTSVDTNQDSDFQRTEYVGRSLPEGDQAIKGWSGSMELEVKDASVDDIIDALVTGNLNGIGASDFSFVSTENYSDGSSRSYVYFDVQLKMSKRQAGLSQKITKRLDWQASGRQAL